MAGHAHASEGGGPPERMEMTYSFANPNWGIERFAAFAVLIPQDAAQATVWMSRDRAGGACGARPGQRTAPGTRWLVGRPGVGVARGGAQHIVREIRLHPTERGRLRVCAWALVRTRDEVGELAPARWWSERRILRVPRVVPTARERRVLRALVSRHLRPMRRAAAAIGDRPIVSIRISRVDRSFAAADVRPARMRFQGGGTIYHFREGRWRALDTYGSPSHRFCMNEPLSGRVPERVLRGFYGSGVCR